MFFYRYVDPGESISSLITELTGIDDGLLSSRNAKAFPEVPPSSSLQSLGVFLFFSVFSLASTFLQCFFLSIQLFRFVVLENCVFALRFLSHITPSIAIRYGPSLSRG